MPSSFIFQLILFGVLTISKCGTFRKKKKKKIGNIRTHFNSNLNLILAKVWFQFMPLCDTFHIFCGISCPKTSIKTGVKITMPKKTLLVCGFGHTYADFFIITITKI